MRFEFFLAARYLRAKRRQAVVGVVTAISVAGVAAGVAALIIALAITNGMQRDLQDRLLGSSAHVELMRVQADGIRDWRPLLDRLRQLPHVTAAAPGIYEEVMVSHGPRAGFALVKGIIPNQERTVSNLLDTLTSGSAASALDPATPIPPARPCPRHWQRSRRTDRCPGRRSGRRHQSARRAEPGHRPRAQVPVLPHYRHLSLRLLLVRLELAFMRLADAQRLFDEPDLLSVISFKVDDLNRAPEIGSEIEQAAGKGFMTTNWIEQNRELFRALNLEQEVTFIVIALIVIVAALNILIALTMMVMEKTRDIAVMMSFGVEPGQVRRIFLMQGLLISLVGTALGLVIGYAAAWAGGHYHFIHLSAEVYSIDTLPFAPRAIDGVIVSAVSICISILATLYPSSAAARVLPAEALRYE